MSMSSFLLGMAVEQDRTMAVEDSKREVEYALERQARENYALQREMDGQRELEIIRHKQQIAQQEYNNQEAHRKIQSVRNENHQLLVETAQELKETATAYRKSAELSATLWESNKKATEGLQKAEDALRTFSEQKKQIVRENIINGEKLNLLTNIKYILMTYNKNSTASFIKKLTGLVEIFPDRPFLELINHPMLNRVYLEIARDIAIQKNPKNILYVDKGKISEENYLFSALLQEHLNPYYPFAAYVNIDDMEDEQFNPEGLKKFYQHYLHQTLSNEQAEAKIVAARGDYRTAWTKRVADSVEYADTKTIQGLEVTKLATQNRNYTITGRTPERADAAGYTIGRVKV